MITSFLQEALVDEVYIYLSPKVLGNEGAVEVTRQMIDLKNGQGLINIDRKSFGNDVRVSGLIKNSN